MSNLCQLLTVPFLKAIFSRQALLLSEARGKRAASASLARRGKQSRAIRVRLALY